MEVIKTILAALLAWIMSLFGGGSGIVTPSTPVANTHKEVADTMYVYLADDETDNYSWDKFEVNNVNVIGLDQSATKIDDDICSLEFVACEPGSFMISVYYVETGSYNTETQTKLCIITGKVNSNLDVFVESFNIM